jgi:hypothetical protein
MVYKLWRLEEENSVEIFRPLSPFSSSVFLEWLDLGQGVPSGWEAFGAGEPRGARVRPREERKKKKARDRLRPGLG